MSSETPSHLRTRRTGCAGWDSSGNPSYVPESPNTRAPKWLRTDEDARAQRKALRIATAARKASRLFGLYYRWAGVDEAKESHYWDKLVDVMGKLKTTIESKDDRL